MQAPNSLQLFEANRWLERTGIESQVIAMQPLPHGYAHRNDLLTLEQGEQVVLRRYLNKGMVPARKERGFYGLLRHQAAVPAPRVLGILSTDDAAALVLEYVHGVALGDVAPNLPDGPFEDVHRSVGAALKNIHTIAYRIGGLLVGEDLVPFPEGSWGGHILADVKRDVQLLVDARLLTRTASTTVIERFQAAVPLMNDYVPTLVHGDFHPWNVLVSQQGDTWGLRAVLDLESAMVGDPQYDLARFLSVRFGSYPAVPQSFFAGYGGRADPERHALYTTAIMLHAARGRGGSPAMSPYLVQEAAAYVRQLPKQLDQVSFGQ